jgi:hypothetical protein
MSVQLKRAAGYLRRVGFDVSPSKRSGHKRDRLITVSRIPLFPNKSFEPPSAPSAPPAEDDKTRQVHDLPATLNASLEETIPSASTASSAKNGAEDPDFLPPEPKDSTSDRWEVEY